MLKRVLAAFLLIVIFPVYADDDPWAWSAALTLEAIGNLEGGAQTGWRGLGNLDITLSVDTEAAGMLPNGEVFLYVLGNAGKNPSDLTGDLQGVSNIAADEALKVYEFWYQHSFFEEGLKVLVGLHDYNSTFYSLDSAGLFTHPSFGIGPDTSQVGPSIFSTTAMAIHARIQGEQQYLLLAAYDGVPGHPGKTRGTHVHFDEGDGIFYAAEWGLFAEDSFKFSIGGWLHTAEVENPINNRVDQNNHGVYFLGEKTFFERWHTFFQVGLSDKNKNQLSDYYGFGVTLSDAWIHGDSVGLAVASAVNSEEFLVVNTALEKSETAWELTYFYPMREKISLQSSVYSIQNPSMDRAQKNALAVGVRVVFEF